MNAPLRRCLALSAVLTLSAVARAQSASEVLIPAGSPWRYRDTGVNLGTAWRDPGYADGTWTAGPAEFGYGDGGEATLLSYGPNASSKYPCYYFRHTFSVADPALYQTLSLDVLRDDGCVVYLNGQEVARLGMPSGTISYSTYASAAVEYPWDTSVAIPNLLVPGANLLAVEVHQGNASSSDLSFDLALKGQYRAPTVTLIAPADQAVARDSTVSFVVGAEDPTGLASATLVVTTPPQTLTLSGPPQTVDAEIRQLEPDTNFGTASSTKVDGENPHAHTLLQFPPLVGSQPGQLPAGTLIGSAQLRVYCTNPGNPLRIFRLTEAWSEGQVTWNARSVGLPWSAPGADGPASHAAEEVAADCSATGWRTVDVTALVQAWSDGALNHGFVLLESGTDGVDFASSESSTPPELVISYGGTVVHSEVRELTGTSATVQFDVTLAQDSDYLWNCEVQNLSGLRSWAATSHRLTVDSHYPAVPTLVQPADGATSTALTPVLTVNVADPDQDPLDVTFYGRGGNLAATEFTLIFLPDTQKYVLSPAYAPIFTKQTQWIVNQREALNIVFVSHGGDICDTYNSVPEHDYAAASLSLLDGVVPYGLLPGNHDQPTTLYNSYWPYTKYHLEPWYGGHYPANGNDNSFQRFSAGGMDFLILHLQAGPGTDVIAWADTVLKAHPNHKAILSTHGFLGLNGERNVDVMGSTQYIWDGLAVPNDNLHFVLCGHMHGEFTRTDVVNGRQVHQLLADYQTYPEGGQGWLRVMRFIPAYNQVQVMTYSPHLNSFQTDADSEFSLDFPMNGFAALGTLTAVPSGADAQWVWDGLQPNTAYEWYARATDPTGRATFSPVWHLTTGTGDVLPPQADAQSVTLLEDQPTEILLTASDPDTAAGDLIFTVVNQPASGVLSGTAPNLSYTPNADFHGADQFTFTVSDGTTVSAPATVSLAVTPVNDAPVAQGLTLSLTEDASLSFTLNGSDPESSPLTFEVQAPPDHGTFSGLAPNLVYTPHTDYAGSDSLTFTVSDGELSSAPATVTLTITPVNDVPVGHSSSLALAEDEAVTLELTATDPDNVSLSYEVVTPPSQGVLSGTPPNLTYTPGANFHGADQFAFTVSDGTATSTEAVVSLTVNPVNDPPQAQDQTLQTQEDTELPITLTGLDVDGDTLTLVVLTSPGHGTLTGTAPGLVYQPETNYFGPDSFTFVARDGALESAPATVRITVTQFNHPPVAENQDLATTEDVSRDITLTTSDPDTAAGDLIFAVVTGPASGVLSGTAPNLSYTPNADFHGVDQFTFTVSDGTTVSAAATVTLTVTPVNDAPVAQGMTLNLSEDGSLALALSGSDPETSSLIFAVQALPTHGALSGSAPNLVYTPDADYAGPDSLTFVVSDGELSSAPATVTLTVAPVNDAPVANPVLLFTAEDQALNLQLTATDPDSASLTYVVVLPPSRGGLLGTAPNLTYIPNPNFHGADQFTFTVSDGTATSTEAVVSLMVIPVNDPPLAQDQTLQTQEDTELPITLTGSDLEGDGLEFVILTEPGHGTLSGTAPTLVYEPASGYFGPDSFTFVVRDGALESAPATVQITVTQFNNSPVAQAGPDQSALTGQAVLFDGSGSLDPDGTIVAYLWDFGDGSSPASGVSASHGYGAPGVYTVTLTVTDNEGVTATDTATVTVTTAVTEIEVFADSFEVGEWNGLWSEDSQNDWYRSAQRATQGTRSAEVDGSAANASLTSIAINLQGRTNARISFDWLIESGLDAGEYLDFRVSTNGGSTWTAVTILRGNVETENVWHPFTLNLTGISQLRLQFRGKMSDASEDANVDNVKVLAY